MPATLLQVRQRVGERSDLATVIPNEFINSIDSDGVVSRRFFGNTNLGQQPFSSVATSIFRPVADNLDDRFRWAGDVNPNTAKLSLAGDPYTDIDKTDEYLELWREGIQPDVDVLGAIQRTQAKLGTRLHVPLTLVPNGGFDDGTTGWAPIFGAALNTDDALVLGKQSLTVTNSVANDVALSQPVAVTPGAQLFIAALGLATNGTNRVAVLNPATGTFIYEKNFETRRAAVAQDFVTVPSGCFEVRVGVGGVEDDAATKWDAVWMYQTEDGRLFLPSEIQEAWEFESVNYMRFNRSLQGVQNVWDARTMTVNDIPFADYQVADMPADTHTPVIQFNDWVTCRRWLRYPLTIQARTRDSNFVLLTDEDDITMQPLELIASGAILELLDTVQTAIPDANRIRAQAWKEYSSLVSARGARGPARRQQAFSARWIG